MSAEFGKQLLYFRKLFKHVVGRDGSSGAFESVLSPCYHKRGTVIAFLELARNKSCYALMNIGKKYDEYFIIKHILFFNELYGRIKSRDGHVLAVIVKILDMRSFLKTFIVIIRQQKLYGISGLFEASCGIDRRSYDKGKRICANTRSIEGISAHKSPEPHIIRCLDTLNPFTDQISVLIRKLHYITYRAECGKLYGFFQCIIKLRTFRTRCKRCHEFICDHRTAYSLIRINASVSVRVNNCFAFGKDLLFLFSFFGIRNLVVIRNNDLHSELIRKLNLRSGSNSVIAGDDKLYTFIGCFSYQIVIDSVTVPETVGDRIGYISARSGDTPDEDHGRGDSVDIIITYDAYFISRFYGVKECADCLIHIG